MKRRYKKTFWLFLCSYLAVLLIPLLILTSFWAPRMRENAQHEARIQAQSSLSQIVSQTDQQISNIYLLPNRIFSHPRIILSSVMDSPLSRKNAVSDLSEMLSSNIFIECMMLYMRDRDYFLSIRVPSFYFSDLGKYPGIYQMSLGNMPLHEMYSLLETTRQPQVMFADSVGLSGNIYNNALLFFLPVPNESKAIATCFVCVLASQLDRIVEPVLSAGGSCLFFDKSGNLVYASGDITRSAIDDMMTTDLPISRNMSAKTVRLNGADYAATYVTSAKTGWRYVSLMPMDVVLQSTNRVQREMVYILLVTLALSSIAVFSAMRLNYTPIHRLFSMATQELPTDQPANDFEQIQRLIVSLRSENQTLDTRLNRSNGEIRDILLNRVLCGNEQEIKRAVSSSMALQLDMGERKWQVFIAEYADQNVLDNIAAAIEAEPDVFVVPSESPRQLVCVRHDAREEHLSDRLMQVLGPLQRLVISDLVDSLSELYHAYSVACESLDYMQSADVQESILYCSSLPERFYNPRFYPLEVMQALESSIIQSDREQMNDLIHQIEGLLMVEGAPAYYTRSIYYNTISLLINGLRSISQGNEALITELTTRSVLPRYTVREMTMILRSTTEKLSTIMEKKDTQHSLWEEELTYIDQHLSSPSFGLQEIADHMNMSASTFSRSFKEKVGKNFKEYVDELRIIRTRELLGQTDMPIEKIALEVGYENLTSFYRFFKKQTGVSPGTYRDAYRNETKNDTL